MIVCCTESMLGGHEVSMTKLTLTIDEELLKQARVRAIEQGTSVNALVCGYLEDFVGRGPQREGIDAFMALTESVGASSGPGGRSWTRDELYGQQRSSSSDLGE